MKIRYFKERHKLLIHLATLWLADCNNKTTDADPLNLSELHTTILRQRFIERKTIREISENAQLTIFKTQQCINEGVYALRKKYDPQYFKHTPLFYLRKENFGANF